MKNQFYVEHYTVHMDESKLDDHNLASEEAYFVEQEQAALKLRDGDTHQDVVWDVSKGIYGEPSSNGEKADNYRNELIPSLQSSIPWLANALNNATLTVESVEKLDPIIVQTVDADGRQAEFAHIEEYYYPLEPGDHQRLTEQDFFDEHTITGYKIPQYIENQLFDDYQNRQHDPEISDAVEKSSPATAFLMVTKWATIEDDKAAESVKAIVKNAFSMTPEDRIEVEPVRFPPYHDQSTYVQVSINDPEIDKNHIIEAMELVRTALCQDNATICFQDGDNYIIDEEATPVRYESKQFDIPLAVSDMDQAAQAIAKASLEYMPVQPFEGAILTAKDGTLHYQGYANWEYQDAYYKEQYGRALLNVMKIAGIATPEWYKEQDQKIETPQKIDNKKEPTAIVYDIKKDLITLENDDGSIQDTYANFENAFNFDDGVAAINVAGTEYQVTGRAWTDIQQMHAIHKDYEKEHPEEAKTFEEPIHTQEKTQDVAHDDMRLEDDWNRDDEEH